MKKIWLLMGLTALMLSGCHESNHRKTEPPPPPPPPTETCYEIVSDPLYVDNTASGSVYDIDVYDGELFVGRGSSIDVFAISKDGLEYQRNLMFSGTRTTFADGYGFWVRNGVMYINNSYTGEAISQVDVSGGASNLIAQGGYVYAENGRSIKVINVTDIANPYVEITIIFIKDGDMAISNGLMIIPRQGATDIYTVEGVEVRLQGTINEKLRVPVISEEFFLAGLRDDNTYAVYDIVDPHNPQPLGQTANFHSWTSAIECGYHLIADYGGGYIEAWDIATMIPVAAYQISSPSEMVIKDGLLFVQISGADVRMYDLTQSAPVK